MSNGSSCPVSCPGPLLTAGDLCRWLRVSRSSVYGWVRRGWLPCIRVGGVLRFDPVEVDAFLTRPGTGISTPRRPDAPVPD